jgi:hypothetical protein
MIRIYFLTRVLGWCSGWKMVRRAWMRLLRGAASWAGKLGEVHWCGSVARRSVGEAEADAELNGGGRSHDGGVVGGSSS